MGTGGAAVLLTDGPAVMTDDGPSAKRRRLPGLEGALAQRALCEGAGPPPWLVQDMLTGETLEFDGRSGYHLAQARQVAGLYFRADRPLAVIAADGSSFVGHNDGLAKLVKPSREHPEPGLSEKSFRCVGVCARVCVCDRPYFHAADWIPFVLRECCKCQGCGAVAFDLRTRKKERRHPSHLLAARARQAAVTGKADVGWLQLRCAACGPDERAAVRGGEGVSLDAVLAQRTAERDVAWRDNVVLRRQVEALKARRATALQH